jgi:formylglycine-generating enzyme required for sulfatase activity
MDRTEVTNAQFAQFVAATGYLTEAERPVDPLAHPGLSPDMLQPGAVVFVMPRSVNGLMNVSQWWHYIVGANWRHPGGPDTSIEGHADFPVVNVTYKDALAYAQWRGADLPLEVEWEWAARAARPEPAEDHAQPTAANTWQGIFPVFNTGEDGFVGLAPAGCFAPNTLGLYDMIGNAWELTASRWSPDHSDGEIAPDQVPVQLHGPQNQQRVIKGGSFLCAPNYCMRYRAGSRQPQEEDLAASHLGFRTILRMSND